MYTKTLEALFTFGTAWNSAVLADSVGDVLSCAQLTELVSVLTYAGHGPAGDMYIDAHERRCGKTKDHPTRW